MRAAALRQTYFLIWLHIIMIDLISNQTRIFWLDGRATQRVNHNVWSLNYSRVALTASQKM